MVAILGCSSSEDLAGAETDTEGSGWDSSEPAGFTPVCGNGRREDGEACDLGIGNEVGSRCTAMCTEPVCGDGELAPWEECDDGNTVAADGCSPTCLVEGRPLWSVTADGDARDEQLWDLALVGDGYIGVGTLSRSFYDSVPIVVAFDGAGEGVRWRQTMESGYGEGIARRVLAVQDDAVVAGTIVDDDGRRRAWMARFGPDGQRRFSRSLSIAQARGITGMVEGSAGRALVIGDFDTGPGSPRRSWVAEVDLLDAAVLWTEEIAAEHELSTVEDIAAVGDGWVLGGKSGSADWVGRYDATWSVLWEHSWGTHYNPFPLAVTGAADGRVYAAGAASSREPESDWTFERHPSIVALEPDGSVAWEIHEPTLPEAYDFAADVEVDERGGVWVTGEMKTQPLMVSASFEVDAWVHRYDRDGTRTAAYAFDGSLHAHDRGLALVVTGPDSVTVAGASSVLFEGHNPWIASFGPGDRPPIPVPSRPPAVERADHVRSSEVHRTSLFIDFGGRELRQGNWGTHGETPCLGETIELPGYLGDRARAEAIVEKVEELLSPFGVAVHWRRRPPAQLPYTTVVVGGSSEQIGLDERVRGFSCVTDCGDRWSRDLAFAFDGAGPTAIAMNIVHEAAHTWGLDHEMGIGNVMQPFAGPGGSWSTQCVPVSDATNGPACDVTNREFCPSGQQNSDAVLSGLFGTSEVDDEPPTIEIRSPESGTIHPLGEPVVLELEVADDRGNPGFLIAVDELEWSRVAVGTETRFDLFLPPGTFEIRVEAVDHGGNEARDSVTIEVTPP
jgi:cysteine-rich repeat protein